MWVLLCQPTWVNTLHALRRGLRGDNNTGSNWIYGYIPWFRSNMATVMALKAPISRIFSTFLPAFSNVFSVRLASKKASGTSRNKRCKTRGKSRGWKRQDGSFVHSGEVLVRQLGLRYYPGENVRLGRDNTIYAMTDGKVVITCEKLSPYPDSPLYESVKSGLVIYKKFFNILATPLHGKFRLVSQV